MTTFSRYTLVQSVTSPYNPGAGSDDTQGFSVGSTWFNSATGVMFTCASSATGAAKWVYMPAETVLGYIDGANMNVDTDQVFTMLQPLTSPFSISKILATNASVDLDTAVGGVYSASGKGGTAIVANTQVYTALTTSSKIVSLTLASGGTGNVFTSAPYLSLTTEQGAAATCDFYLIGNVLGLS